MRLCLRGGFVFAAATLLLTPTVAETVDTAVFLQCMVLSCPLLDAVGHVGRYYAGIGLAKPQTQQQPAVPLASSISLPPLPTTKGTRSKKDGRGRSRNKHPRNGTVSPPQSSPPAALPPTALPSTMDTATPVLALPLIASLLSAGLYALLLTAHLAGAVPLDRAGALALALQAAIGYEVEHRRGDVVLARVRVPGTGKSVAWAEVLMVGQVVAACGYLQLPACGHPQRFVFSDYLVVWFGYNALLTAGLGVVEWSMANLSLPAGVRVSEGGAGAGVSEGVDGNVEGGVGGGGQGSGEKGVVVAAAVAAAPDGERKRARRNWGQVGSVAATAALCLVLLGGVYFDAMPAQVTSVEQARRSTAEPGFALWSAAASWQFVVSTVGVGVLPVVVVQVLS